MSIISHLNPRNHWRLEQLWPMMLVFLAGCYLAPDSKFHNNLFYSLVLLPALILLTREDLRRVWHEPVTRIALLFLGYLALSSLWSIEQAGDLARPAKQWIYMGAYVVVLARIVQSRPDRVGWLLTALVAAALIGGSIALYDHLRLLEARKLSLTRLLSWRRLELFGRLDHPIIGASTYGLACVIAAWAALAASRWWWRAGAAAITLALLSLVVLTYSRGPLAAVAVTILAAAVLLRRWWIVGLFVLAYCGVAAGMLSFDWDPGRAVARGLGPRPEIWAHVWRAFLEQPLFGHGLLTPEGLTLAKGTSIDHPHSAFLATLFYGGVVGGGLLLWMLAIAGCSGWTVVHRGGWSLPLVLLIYAVLIVLTDNDKLLLSPRPLWLYFWLPVLLCIAVPAVQRAPLHRAQRDR